MFCHFFTTKTRRHRVFQAIRKNLRVFVSLYSINFHPSLCIPRQPLQWWYVVHQFCHALVMMEIDFTGFAITVLGYDDDTQAIGGISTLLIDGLAVEGRAAKQHYHIRILLYGAASRRLLRVGRWSMLPSLARFSWLSSSTGISSSLASSFALRLACATSCSRLRFFWSPSCHIVADSPQSPCHSDSCSSAGGRKNARGPCSSSDGRLSVWATATTRQTPHAPASPRQV